MILKIYPITNCQYDRRLHPDPIQGRLQRFRITQFNFIAIHIPLPPSPIHIHTVFRPRYRAGRIGFLEAVVGGVVDVAEGAGGVTVVGGAVGGGFGAVSAAPNDTDKERA